MDIKNLCADTQILVEDVVAMIKEINTLLLNRGLSAMFEPEEDDEDGLEEMCEGKTLYEVAEFNQKTVEMLGSFLTSLKKMRDELDS